MQPARVLALYGVGLAAVLGVALGVGSAASPVGLATAEPETADHGGDAGDEALPGLAAAGAGLRLVPTTDTDTIPAGSPAPFAFRIVDDDGPVTSFDVEQTKRMHLIVVRRDFVGFLHEHPTMSPDGTWTSTLTLTEPGAYRAFADFVVDGEKQTLATDLFVAGDFRPVVLEEPSSTADAGDGYTVELAGQPVPGEESRLEFTVRRSGRVVRELPPYLGTQGHLVALRDGDLAYLHVHADDEELAFEADFPTPGAYRLFLQFQHGGRVRTAAFTVVAGGGGR